MARAAAGGSADDDEDDEPSPLPAVASRTGCMANVVLAGAMSDTSAKLTRMPTARADLLLPKCKLLPLLLLTPGSRSQDRPSGGAAAAAAAAQLTGSPGAHNARPCVLCNGRGVPSPLLLLLLLLLLRPQSLKWVLSRVEKGSRCCCADSGCGVMLLTRSCNKGSSSSAPCSRQPHS